MGRHYEGGSQGVSFRLAKGITYRVGAHRGHLVSDKQVMPVSTGNFVMTNKRAVFAGDAKSFALKFDKIINLELYANGLKLMDDKGKPRVLEFGSRENVDVVGAILSYAINHLSWRTRT